MRKKDPTEYIGQKHNKLSIISIVGKDKKKQILVKCLCDCGQYKDIAATLVVRGAIKSCGNCRHKYIGKSFGQLKIIDIDKDKHNDIIYKAECNCGNIVFVTKRQLIQQNQKQCRICYYKTRTKYCGLIPIWIIQRVKRGAKLRSIEYNLTNDYLSILFEKQKFLCALSGIKLNTSKYKDSINSNLSLDRIDSNIGYVEGNVQWVDKRVNKMKWDLKQEDFISICGLIYEQYQAKKC